MPRLIHLNGPPGIGKSTLARRFANDHSGTLNLDIDQLRGMIGGWRDQFVETGQIVRPLALAMASIHLRGGRDVVVPQYLGKISEVERLEAVASNSGAQFCELVLTDTKHQALRRFAQRGDDDELDWHRYIQQFVRDNGGDGFLSRMYDQLGEVIQARPSARVLTTTAGAIEQGYAALISTLASMPPSTNHTRDKSG